MRRRAIRTGGSRPAGVRGELRHPVEVVEHPGPHYRFPYTLGPSAMLAGKLDHLQRYGDAIIAKQG